MLGIEIICVLLIGGLLYGLIELLFRGHTHWTMVVTGGLCFAFIYLMSTRSDLPLILKCLTAALFITAVEFVVGCIVNRRFRLDVWDYSNKRYNVLGQVCPLFTVVWFFLSFPGVWLSGFIGTFF